MLTVWIAENESGSVQFDTPPSTSDILNACEDLLDAGDVAVYAVDCTEVNRDQLFTVTQPHATEIDGIPRKPSDI